MPFELKNAPSEFQHIMNDILNDYCKFLIVYIYDVLIYSKNLHQHFKHLKTFFNVIKYNGLVVSAPKIKLFQTKIWFSVHYTFNGTIYPFNGLLNLQISFHMKSKTKIDYNDFFALIMLQISHLNSEKFVNYYFNDLRKILQHGPRAYSSGQTRQE